MIGIIDLGTGNLFSLFKVLKKCGIEYSIVSTPEELSRQNKLLLPGVGAFPAAMEQLKKTGLDVALGKAVKDGKTVVGICLGMQLLLESSEEFSLSTGLGLIKGSVKKLNPNPKLRRPNIGWNEVIFKCREDYFKLSGFINERDFYFAHSYYCDLENEENILGYYCFGSDKIPAVISDNKNLLGLQFHPEMSGEDGIRLLSHIIKELN